MKTSHIIILVALLGVLLLGVFWMINERGPALNNTNETPPAGAIAMEGVTVCLPHKDTNGIQTLECAYGLHGDDGNYYALSDTNAVEGSLEITSLPVDTRVLVEGVFIPEEGTTYATVGRIEIATLTEYRSDGSPVMNETHSDGNITFSVPENFGLAVNQQQVPNDSSVPPCAEGFDYCLYYLGMRYDTTNFESAGVAIGSRTDLEDVDSCLYTSVAGYADLEPLSTTTEETHQMSLFSPIEDAATGQYTTGEVYRLFTSDVCYEFSLRVGESQYENIPEESVTRFTDDERDSLLDSMRSIIDRITLDDTDGTSLSLPEAI